MSRDLADMAQSEQDMQLRVAMRAQEQEARKHSALLNQCSGECLNCREPLSQGRFCDEDCRGDWQKRMNNRPLPV